MTLKGMQPNADDNHTNDYFDALRQKNYEASFEGVKDFIAEHKDKLRPTRRRRPVRQWQWVLAVLLPVLVVLACTKTERTEAVGSTVSFSVPEKDDAARQELESVVGGLQTVVTPDKGRPGYLSYTCFIPAQYSRPADAVISQLKAVKGISGLSVAPMSAPVRESLLSHLGYKIFSTHIDATGLRDEELQNTIMRQLKEKGFHDISVSVARNEKGARTLELHPAEGASNYRIDVSLDDKGTKLVLQEEQRTLTGGSASADQPPVDFGRMTDAQVRDHIRRQHGKDLRDEDIKITRTADEIAIEIKESDKREEVMRFKLHGER